MRKAFLPFSAPSIGDEEVAEVVDSLRSGWVTTGPKTRLFEEQFKAYIGAKHAIAVNSCTAALRLALCALGIGPGDEVVIPTLTFCSTANVVVHLGARPVLVDVGEDFNVTPQSLEQAITPRTKALVPVHYAGQPCDLRAIYELASRHNLAVVEDAAHAVGATFEGSRIGSDHLAPTCIGQREQVKVITCFSFYATKNMTTGEGGMITTSDDELAERMRLLSLHGMSRDAWKRYTSTGSWYYEVTLPGYKDNLPDIMASLGIHQLRKLESFVTTRRYYAHRYDEAFRNMPEIAAPITHPDRDHAFHLYVIRLNLAELNIDRSQFIEELKAQNIGASVHFIPVHLHPYYRKAFGYKPGDCPIAERLYERIISLPLFPGMSGSDCDDVIRAVKETVARHRVGGGGMPQ